MPDQSPILDPKRELPIPHDMLLSVSHWQKLKKPSISRKLLLTIVFLLLLVLFLPIPSYKPLVAASCEAAQVHCPQFAGWFLGASLAQTLHYTFTTRDIFPEPSQQHTLVPLTLTPSPTIIYETLPSFTPPSTWKTITYKEQGFSFQYPPDKLFLDYPERCFQAMKYPPATFFVQFHLTPHPDDWYTTSSYKTCDTVGEDGSQFSVTVNERERDIEKMYLQGSTVEFKKIHINGVEAFIVNYHSRGGEGGNRIYFNKTGYKYEIYIPSEKSGPGTKIDPLFMNILSTFKFSDNLVTNPLNSKLLSIAYLGGLCPDGRCERTIEVEQSGKIISNSEKERYISPVNLTKLQNLTATADFAAIKANKFTGTCPTAYDGQEITYTFYLGSQTETIASCTVAIDTNSPLFKTIDDLVLTLNTTPSHNFKTTCESKGGVWLEQYKECESTSNDKGLDQASCTAHKGTFNACGSACRHDPNVPACTTNCVQICKF